MNACSVPLSLDLKQESEVPEERTSTLHLELRALRNGGHELQHLSRCSGGGSDASEGNT